MGSYAFSLDTVETGTYSVDITSNGAKINFLTLLVKAKATNETEPLMTKCWTSAGQEDVNLDNKDRLVIYGQAMQGVNPVIGAVMSAELAYGDGKEDQLYIKDDGIAPDSIKGDGIYSGYYIAPASNSDGIRYSLVCKVEGTNQTSVVNTTSITRSLPSHPSSTTPICCGSVAVKVLYRNFY